MNPICAPTPLVGSLFSSFLPRVGSESKGILFHSGIRSSYSSVIYIDTLFTISPLTNTDLIFQILYYDIIRKQVHCVESSHKLKMTYVTHKTYISIGCSQKKYGLRMKPSPLDIMFYILPLSSSHSLVSHIPQKASTGLMPLNSDLPISFATVCRMVSSFAL